MAHPLIHELARRTQLLLQRLVKTIRSIYRWQGEIEDRPEAHVTLHTRTSLVAAIVDQTTARHPYLAPCVVATPITIVNPAYRQWILDETQEPTREHP